MFMQTIDYTRFEKHEEQISDIKDVISNLSNQISVMTANYSHISEQLKEVLSEVKKMREEHARITHLDSLVATVVEKNIKLENKLNEHDDFYKRIDDKIKRKEEMRKIILSSWFIPLTSGLMIAIAWIIDFVYRYKIK